MRHHLSEVEGLRGREAEIVAFTSRVTAAVAPTLWRHAAAAVAARDQLPPGVRRLGLACLDIMESADDGSWCLLEVNSSPGVGTEESCGEAYRRHMVDLGTDLLGVCLGLVGPLPTARWVEVPGTPGYGA